MWLLVCIFLDLIKTDVQGFLWNTKQFMKLVVMSKERDSVD